MQVDIAHEAGTTTATIAGEIDLLTSVTLNRQLEAAVDGAPEWLRLDLREVTYMDTSGVAVLLKARRRALAAGCRFTVKSASPAIQRLLEITGLASLLSE